MSKYKDKDIGVALTFNGKWVSVFHTILAYSAFLGALIVGVSTHYHTIVKNEYWGYPEEWFPSVSATIGDRYPARAVFQLLIALTSGPRFALVALWYIIASQRRGVSTLPKFQIAIGLIRTLSCGGFTYVTSTDDHDFHDVVMIIYLVGTIPWTACCIAMTPANSTAIRLRKYIASCFFGTIVPLVYWFIQHKVHRIAGAYTIYAFFEWSLILFDVGFDAVTLLDFSALEITIREAKGISDGTSTTIVAAAEEEKTEAIAHAFDARFSFREVLDTFAEVYHGFVFWSMLSSLGLVIWYFPLWYMGISGYEVLVMSTISPLILVIKPIRSLVIGNLRWVHYLSLAGLAAWRIEEPEHRLFTVGFGVSMSCLGWAATLYSESVREGRLESRILALMAGLILSSTAKFAWWTNNPIWPVMYEGNNGYNRAGLAVAIVACWIFTRRAPLNTGPPDPNLRGSAILSALGIAGLFFGLHSLLSDTSTMILWVWTGYPVQGPQATTHGWFTVIAMTAGLLTGVQRPQLTGSFLAFIIGCGSVAVLTAQTGWVGYSGALTTAFYLSAVGPPFLTVGAKKSPAIVFGLGFLIYNFLVLFHVWVVAYAFVPGGPYVREHTDWVNMTMMVLIGAGVLNLQLTSQSDTNSNSKTSTKPAPMIRHRKYYIWALAGTNMLFIMAAYLRFPTNDYRPYHPESKLITAGIWTIHFSLDNKMYSSEYRVRDLIRELELDVIGLLESDLQRIIMGNRDTTQFLAEDLGMYVDYGPGPNKHTWGSALLSKFPIVNSTHHLLPSPTGELAPAIHATLDCYGELVDVFVFHSGQEEDPGDRRLQSEYMANLMGSSPRPAFLLSYLVTEPLRENYNTYVSPNSGMHDIDPSDWDRWCEYILYKNLNRVGYARVSRHTITDTELQVAKFVVPTTAEEKAAVKSLDTDPNARNRKAREHEVPEGWRFPGTFRGDGVRGHRYHVFNEPRYYLPASGSEGLEWLLEMNRRLNEMNAGK